MPAVLLAAGIFGCGDNQPRDPALTLTTQRLFWDDFEGEEPTQWTPYAGTWELGDMPDSARIYQAPQQILNQTIAGSSRWTDYQVQARVTLNDDRGQVGKVGLLGRVEGTHHYYEFLLGPDADRVPSWFIRRRVDHVWTLLASGPFAYEMGVPYVLRFTLKGEALEGSVASVSASGAVQPFERLGTATDGTFTFGKIGLASYFRSSQFDDVAVDGFGDSVSATQAALESGPWGPIAELRDNTNTFPTGKPAGGWYVTPIHATLRASDGKVLISGFGQKAEANCSSTTQKTVGETFLITPSDIAAVTDGDVLLLQPINQQNLDAARDVLYCSGQTTMADGRIFMAGGTRYPDILPDSNPELGLDYARVFNPTSNTVARVSFPAKGGQASTPGMKWYPTSTLLPDGRILTFGGFHWISGGAGTQKNHSLELFDPKTWDANPAADPYTVLTSHTEGTSQTVPSLGYTNMYVLPKPVAAGTAGGGFARSMVVSGAMGKVFLYNTEPGPSGSQRLIARTNALSVSPASSEKAGGAASVMLPDGKIMLANGSTHGVGSSRAYFYDPYADNWTTLDLGISRTYGNSIWLPDGTVLITNGYVNEPGGTNVSSPVGAPDGPRQVQIVDPFARTFSTQPAWPEPTARGYHNIALLLKDGRVMIGGGKDADHFTGCEKNELRLYSPPYLSAGPRPTITNVSSGQTLSVGGSLTINFTETVRTVRGVALLAPAAMTHGFDQGQRYVPLTVTTAPAGGSVTVALPATINEAPPGDYLLHVVSELGVPSVGVHVRVTAPPNCTFAVNGSVDTFIEAENSSRRAAPFQTVADGARSAGGYLQSNPASADNPSVPDEGQVAWYDVDVSNGGTFFVWLLANGPDTGSDTVYVSANGNADQVITLPAATWGWVRGATSVSLPSGKHTLKIKTRESGARIDQLRLTKSTSTTPPTGPGTPVLGCVVRTITNLVARDTRTTGGDAIANNLQWSIQPSFAGGGGQLAFGDRTYTIGTVPAAAAHLNGKPWISPAVDSKTYVPPAGTPPTYASATVYGSFVYLALDSRHNTSALSAAGYAIQAYSLTVNEGATVRTYNVWRKAVAFGATLNLPTLTTTTPPPYLTIVE